MTKEEYESLIPDCCTLRTVEEHMELLLLCWGITHGSVDKKHECGRECEFHRNHDPQLLEEILKKHR